MKLFITLTKRNLAVLLAAIIVALIVIGQFFSAGAVGIDGSTNQIRVNHLKGLGLTADESGITSKNIIIPEAFSDVYEQYNDLQKKAGFDLSRHKGEEATLYTYPLTDGRQAHIIVQDGKIIGGDVASLKLDGEMKPLT